MKRTANVHERELPVAAAHAGALIDTLAQGGDDRLWPWERWPPMRLDRGLVAGARGGHGPIRYAVLAHEPGVRVRFAFTAPRGLGGEHGFEALALGDDRALLRHWFAGEVTGPMRWQWPLAIRRLHDALVEDALDRAEGELSGSSWHPRPLSRRVRLTRWLVARAAAPSARRPGA